MAAVEQSQLRVSGIPCEAPRSGCGSARALTGMGA